MYSQRTRNIIIGSITIGVTIIVLLILGLTLYATTDLFKSNDTLFYKYALQTLDSLKYVENSQLTEIENLKDEKVCKINGNITYKEGRSNANNENAQIGIQIVQNNPKKESYAKLDLIHNKETIFDVEYAKSNNIVALKSPEIVDAYLGIKNENIRQMAEKLGITNTTLIPNSIENVKFNELFYITEEQKDYIKETYLKILEQNIDKSKFTKEKDLTVSREGESYTTTAYRLNLTDEELKQIEIALLETLKDDDTTLSIIEEKMKMLGLDSIESNSLKNIIQNRIDKVKMRPANPSINGMNILLYTSGGKIITTEIIYENSIKCTIYGTSTESESKRYLLIENLNVNAQFQKVEITENEVRNEAESSYNTVITINDKTQVKVDITNKGSVAENKLNSTCKVEIGEQNKIRTITYKGEMNFDYNNNESIIQLNKSNCGILNDYEENQLKTIEKAVSDKIVEVLNEKLQIIGI